MIVTTGRGLGCEVEEGVFIGSVKVGLGVGGEGKSVGVLLGGGVTFRSNNCPTQTTSVVVKLFQARKSEIEIS